MSRYAITEPAENDMNEILFYVAADNLTAAVGLFERFQARFEMLAQMPQAGRERSELESSVRSFPEGSYVIFYRQISAELIEIVRVLHGARDIAREFVM